MRNIKIIIGDNNQSPINSNNIVRADTPVTDTDMYTNTSGTSNIINNIVVTDKNKNTNIHISIL